MNKCELECLIIVVLQWFVTGGSQDVENQEEIGQEAEAEPANSSMDPS